MRERVAQLNKHYYQGEIDQDFCATIQPQISKTMLTKVAKKAKNQQGREVGSLSKLIHTNENNYQSKPSNESSIDKRRVAEADANSFSSVDDRNQYNELGVSHSDFGSEQFREEINQKRRKESVTRDIPPQSDDKKQKLKAKLDKV